MGMATLIFSSVIAMNSVSPMLTIENYPSMRACQVVLGKVIDQQVRVLYASTSGAHKPEVVLVNGDPNKIQIATGVGRIMAEAECVDHNQTNLATPVPASNPVEKLP